MMLLIYLSLSLCSLTTSIQVNHVLVKGPRSRHHSDTPQDHIYHSFGVIKLEDVLSSNHALPLGPKLPIELRIKEGSM